MPVQENINTIICGALHQETIINALDQVSLNHPGGSLLYAASGYALCDRRIGLVGKTHAQFLTDFHQDLEEITTALEGITLSVHLPNDIRYYRIRSREKWETSHFKRHFYELGQEVPKFLLALERPSSNTFSMSPPCNQPLTSSDFPPQYVGAKALLLTPMDFLSHFSCIPHLRRMGIQKVLIRSSPSYMIPAKLCVLPKLLNGIDFFFTTEQEVKTLFGARFDRYQTMLEILCRFGAAHMVIKNSQDGYLLLHGDDQRATLVPDHFVFTVDPIGEYDCYCGVFTACLATTSRSIEVCAAYASAAASICREGSGVRYILNTYPDILRLRAEMVAHQIISSPIASLTASREL
jgi:hypothetical protein